MPIIIGLGSGRCGTHSLAHLLNQQDGAVCFHEINPSCMTWSESPQTVLSMIGEFQSVLDGGPRQLTIDYSVPNRARPMERMRALDAVKIIGDVGSYYLSYVSILASLPVDIRFPCLKRDRLKTIDSFIEKVRIKRSRRERIGERIHKWITRRPYYTSRNHWIDHDGSTWRKDRIWDKCHPKMQSARTLEQALEKYYDFYYELAEDLANKHSDSFRIFHTEDLNSEDGQRRILEFCGITGAPSFTPVRTNRRLRR